MKYLTRVKVLSGALIIVRHMFIDLQIVHCCCQWKRKRFTTSLIDTFELDEMRHKTNKLNRILQFMKICINSIQRKKRREWMWRCLNQRGADYKISLFRRSSFDTWFIFACVCVYVYVCVCVNGFTTYRFDPKYLVISIAARFPIIMNFIMIYIIFRYFIRGIPWISHNRKARIEAIGKELSLGKYDIVSLQEVWAECDNQLLQQLTKAVLPYSHYFYRYRSILHSPILSPTFLVITIELFLVVSADLACWSCHVSLLSLLSFILGR